MIILLKVIGLPEKSGIFYWELKSRYSKYASFLRLYYQHIVNHFYCGTIGFRFLKK